MWSPQPQISDKPSTSGGPLFGPLFAPSLISPDTIAALPDRYTMRPLQRTDYRAGMLDVLRVLTTVGDISEKDWTERYDWMAKRGDEYFALVVCDGEEKVVGTGCVVVERKLSVILLSLAKEDLRERGS